MQLYDAFRRIYFIGNFYYILILRCKFAPRRANEHLRIFGTRKRIMIMNSESETKVKRKRDPSRLVLENEICIKGRS